MKTVVMVTNIPSPYRVDLFFYMQTHDKEFNYKIIYTNKNESNRQWNIDERKMRDSIILHSRVIRIKGKNDDRFIHFPPNVGKTLSNLKPDAVIAWEYNPAALQSLMWCKRHRIPFIHLTDGTLYSERNIGLVQKISRKFIIRNASAYIASGTKAKEKIMKYGGEESKISISYLTVDRNIFDRTIRKPVKGRILYVGSMVKRKGLDLLLAALKNLKGYFNVHIVGNGTDEQIIALKEFARDNELEDKIEWCGFKEGKSLVDEYMEASLFVLPTREDCFGLVLLEALYAGVPIVASKYADGAYDVIKPEFNGIIEDPYDAQKFARAIDIVLKDERYLNNALCADASKFNFENVSKGILYALEKVFG